MKLFKHFFTFFCLLSNFLTPVVAAAQDTIPPREEIWPEVDMYLRINDRHRLFFMVSDSRQRNSYFTDGSIGIHYDYFLNCISTPPGAKSLISELQLRIKKEKKGRKAAKKQAHPKKT